MGSLVRIAGALGLLAGCASAASHVRSVVRADAHGRLIRTVVVSSRVVQPRIIPAQTPTEGTSAVRPELAGIPDLVESAAKRYDVDPLLVHAMIQTESAYNPFALSPKGAQGLMQLMPATAKRFGVQNVFDVKENIDGGVRYLKYLSSLFPSDPRLAIAAYNAGEGAVWKYGNQIPPYRETEQYVYRVGLKYGQVKRAAEKAQQEKRNIPLETAQAVNPSVSEPVYAPVEAFIDSEGRLHMRTATAAERNP